MTTITAPVSHEPLNHDARVGERVMMLMFRARTTQTSLGKSIGMTQTALSKKIHGERKWTLDDLHAVASALNVSVATLISETETPDPNRPLSDYKSASSAPVISLAAFASSFTRRPGAAAKARA
ncbi:helix-turn-helix domain-containing protein [Microbacterium sp.]|uniref:helix-turn-helix domain-containing protein n=1 Tax=Microbacterium sp. TaxID=51671 RepID=UPI002FE16BAD